MLLSGGRCGRDGDAAERPRPNRDRLETAVSGLEELDFLRQRQEELVRAALEPREAAEARQREAYQSSEEKLLEKNILLLRSQLNCLRRRDVGLLSQLQELDRQISDLRLDTDVSRDVLETDSRPSSGFYELSDAASGSLSNSSNSVFSECFCMAIDHDVVFPTTDEAPSCSECDRLFGGLWNDSSSTATVRRSLSAPQPPAQDLSSLLASSDIQSMFHCDLVSWIGSEVYRYPSPLHAVAVLSPAEHLVHKGHRREEADNEGLKPETTSCVPLASSWPLSSSSPSSLNQTPPHKRLDGYIYSLLQRRAQPVRTCRPRTSISTEPSKIVMRQASLCNRQPPGCGSGPSSGPSSRTFMPSEHQAGITMPSSPQQQASVERKTEEQESISCSETVQSNCQLSDSFHGLGAKTSSPFANHDAQMSSLTKKGKVVLPLAAASTSAPPKHFKELSDISVCSPTKENVRLSSPPDEETLLKPPPPQPVPPKTHQRPLRSAQIENPNIPEQGRVVVPSVTQNEDKSHGIKNVSVHQKARKCGNKKSGALKSAATSMSIEESRHVKVPLARRDKSHRQAKVSLFPDRGRCTHTTTSNRGVSSRTKRVVTPQAEGGVFKPRAPTPRSVRSTVSKYHHHGNSHRRHQHSREPAAVNLRLKHKRDDGQRLRAAAEVPCGEALRRAHRRRKERPGDAYAAASPRGRVRSPYAFAAASDSEYSAECASLFHSTIVDTSEDETSNYTTNCFGDSESGEDVHSAGDTEESGGVEGVGAGGGRGKSRAVGQEAAPTPAKTKACIKIKASHNLKKKILRFRSGSLKLMTTV